jgi:hypothetical protein
MAIPSNKGKRGSNSRRSSDVASLAPNAEITVFPWERAAGAVATELGDHTLDRRGELITAAAHIYRYRLAREPGFADMLIANGRAREVEAARG